MAEFTPEVFGKYFLVDKIATGGMAEIFTAKTFGHGGFEHLLVIKRILAHLGDNEEFVDMFIDEAKVSVALQHANIIRIYDFGKMVENYFIAMEWVDGKDARNILKKLSKQRRFLPVEYAAHIIGEVCRGLDYAHRKTDLQGRPYGIVHRDVSPSNILVSYEGDVKVADFGIAKAESNAYNTKDGVLKGKFEYMSPEQAEGKEIDQRSDIFSAGIILHEMLTGRRLFKTGSDTGTLEKIKSGDYPKPSQIAERVPAELDRIVMKALARDRDQRYQMAKEMADDLTAFLLPSTADQMRGKLARFMAETFTEEIAEERARLEAGGRAAAELRKNVPMPDSVWDGGTNSTMSRSGVTQPQPQTRMLPYALAGGALLVAMFAVAVAATGVGAAMMGQAAAPVVQEPQTIIVEAPPEVPTTGTLALLIYPGGRILLDGEEVGHDKLTLKDLAPGPHTVRVELEDYMSLEEPIEIIAGETTTFMRTLEKEPRKVTASAPRKAVQSPPKADTTRDAPAATAPGKLTVTIMGGGWADIFVNGTKHSKKAPSTLDLPPGNYTVKVSNPGIGVDHTETVSVASGGAVKVIAKPQ